MTIEFIFVYGTLLKETATEMYLVLARHCEFFSNGYMQGKLYEINDYPGAVESENQEDKVYGELYRVINSNFVFSQLDEYEECTDKYPLPHEYIRKNLPIYLSNDVIVYAWVYIFNHNISNLTHIKSGDYLNYLKGKE